MLYKSQVEFHVEMQCCLLPVRGAVLHPGDSARVARELIRGWNWVTLAREARVSRQAYLVGRWSDVECQEQGGLNC